MTMDWTVTANLAQDSLNYFFKGTESQFLNNFYPTDSSEDNKTFNYWWLAHAVDVRLDAYLRTNEDRFLQLAEETYSYNRKRNGDTLIHDFYDDMLWNALAAFRLYQVTGKSAYLDDAKIVWEDLVATGWNEECGGGFAWRRSQMYYKNTPVNAPFIILSTWLYQETQHSKYLDWGIKTYEWLRKTLLRDNEFVEDGINRQQDGQIDTQWQFTYNQGVYIGACLGLYQITGDQQYVQRALRNAEVTIQLLSDGRVFHDEGEGGDEGLFKGIFYRYAAELVAQLPDKTQALQTFIQAGSTLLVQRAEKEGHLLMGMDWSLATSGKVPCSAQLSGMMAIEMAAKLTGN